jgi:cytosine/adenosine deaminase-related metal-dependent hydrolase
MTDYLIKGGCVLTLGARSPNFAEGDVLIEQGRIAEVGTGLRARTAELIDARDTIVMPGFVDGHRHLWKTLARNAGEGSDRVVADELGPEDVYAATLIGLLGAIEAGITTVVDWSDQPHPDAALQAHRDAGVRTVCATSSFGGELAAGNTTIAHASDDANTWARARELGLRVHAHATAPETISGWASRGVLGSDVTLAHCTPATDPDLAALASSGARVVLSPATEMAAFGQFPPIQKLLDRNIRPGLGVDGAGLVPGDIFAQMRSLISLQHATVFDRKLAGKAGLPHLMTTREVIRAGTIDGARAIGLAETTGSLEPGKQADLIVLRADRPNIVPVNDPIGAVVWGMDTSNVDWVFVAGRPLMISGTPTSDRGQAQELAMKALKRESTGAALTTALSGEGS